MSTSIGNRTENSNVNGTTTRAERADGDVGASGRQEEGETETRTGSEEETTGTSKEGWEMGGWETDNGEKSRDGGKEDTSVGHSLGIARDGEGAMMW